MGRILAIDYGQKRTGIASTDPLQIIANGLGTFPSDKIMDFLKEYILKESVELFIVGMPYKMNNEPSDNMPYVLSFVKKLKKVFPSIPVEYVDERFTSKLAKQAILSGGVKKMKRRNKALIDEISAVIILQTYLESRK
ncbi:MAG: Holliday junction resolvase RuvX [Candidatus Azobacteroides sp.]|nr:Holliday junction resolvase RuvX [Candidatus Azobacteroides sp.]